MKRSLYFFLAVSLLFLSACKPSEPVDVVTPTPQVPAPVESTAPQQPANVLAIVRAIHDLPYQDMALSAFHQNIETITKGAGTDIFSLITSYYESPSDDYELDGFVRTTLDYTSQQMYGQPVFVDAISYLTTDTLSALELLEKQTSLEAADYEAYLDSVISEISLHASVVYSVHFTVANLDSTTVSQRDERLFAVRAAAQKALCSLSPEQAESYDAKSLLTQEFTAISQQYSDDVMTCLLTLQTIDSFDNEVYG